MGQEKGDPKSNRARFPDQGSICLTKISKTTGLSRQAIYRLKDDPAWAEGVVVT
jgi:hypothetical protein